MSPSSDALAPLRRRLRAVESTASTMDDAKAWAREGAPTGAVAWALEQRAGRGRWQRGWSSPRGGLWFSYVWRVEFRPRAGVWELVPHAAGVAIADALERETRLPVRLKWPNDVLVDEKKIGGVLVEAVAAAESFAVVGVGVNANFGLDALGGELRLPATTLRLETHRDWSLEPLLASCVASLDNGFAWLVSNPAMVLAAYRSKCVTLGRRVEVDMGDRAVEGVALEVADDGSLVVETAAGPVKVLAGECRHLT